MSEKKQLITNITLESVIETAIRIPGVKVDRDAFLWETFKDRDESAMSDILAGGPVKAGCARSELHKLAQRLVTERTLISTGASFVAGMPGGIAMAATIPADIAQFYGVALRMAQELAYLYGEGDLWAGEKPDSEKVQNQLILYCGVMLGVSGAEQAVRVLSSALAKQALKKLPQKALTKTFYYPIVKGIAKFFGAKMTKDVFAKGVSKALPIIGGVVSGGLTLASMKPMGSRLVQTLDEAHFDYTQEEFEEDWQKIVKIYDEPEVSAAEEGSAESVAAEPPVEEACAEETTETMQEAPAGDVLRRIEQAGKLHAAGVLSDEEFRELKTRLLAQL